MIDTAKFPSPHIDKASYATLRSTPLRFPPPAVHTCVITILFLSRYRALVYRCVYIFSRRARSQASNYRLGNSAHGIGCSITTVPFSNIKSMEWTGQGESSFKGFIRARIFFTGATGTTTATASPSLSLSLSLSPLSLSLSLSLSFTMLFTSFRG